MNQIFVRLQSIFDTALGKLLLDSGDTTFVSPNSRLQKYLGIEASSLPHDVHIGDLDKREGIIIKGVAHAVKKIENLFREALPDCITFSHLIQQDAIYLATVTRYIYRKNLAIVDLGNEAKGIIFNVDTNVGEKLLVQVKELTTELDKLPVCSTVITLSGNYVILEDGANFVRVSRKIKGDDRRRLHELGKNIIPPDFGIIIRTSALNATEDEIVSEIDEILKLWDRIERDAAEAPEAGRLITGEMVSEITFGNASKKYLDNMRATICSTMNDYYHFKAYSMASGFALDFIQNFTDQISLDDISKAMVDMIITRDYPINNHIKAEFKFLDGTNEEIILGDLVQNEGIIKTTKTLTYPPEMKFPNFSVDKGDRMECIFAYGSWTVHYRFYSKDSDNLIGERIRIITPLDLAFRGRVRAFDTGMNLYKAEGETSVSIVDNSISNMVERGMISRKLDERFGEVLKLAMDELNESKPEIIIQFE
ncbi:MAG: ribonuclease E/G [Candidatus Kariarchaeaceae archaeon]|jgi:hypothetical protein